MYKNEEVIKEAVALMVQQLFLAAKVKGISQRDLVQRTGLQESNISRIKELKYTPTLETYLRLCAAVEIRPFIDLSSFTSEQAEFLINEMDKLKKKSRPD